MQAHPLKRKILADVLDMLAAVYAGPGAAPDQCLEMLRQMEQFGTVDETDSPAPLPEKLNSMLQAWTVPLEEREGFCEEMESEYVRVFVNTLGGVAAPLYQSVYEPGSKGVMGGAHKAMLQRLAQGGLVVDDAVAPGEPADHLCIELEYLRHLLLAGEDTEARGFAAEMLEWTRKMDGAAREAGVATSYRAAGDLLLAVLAYLASESDETETSPSSATHS